MVELTAVRKGTAPLVYGLERTGGRPDDRRHTGPVRLRSKEGKG